MTSTISVAIQAAIAWLEGQEREGGKTGVYMRERGKGERRSKGERKERRRNKGRKKGEKEGVKNGEKGGKEEKNERKRRWEEGGRERGRVGNREGRGREEVGKHGGEVILKV